MAIMTPEETMSAIPGSSMTKKKGELPFEKPARTSNPEHGIQLIFDAITEPKSAQRLMKTLKDGTPIDVVVDSLATLMLGEGIVSPQALPIMAPAMATMIEGMAKVGKVPVKYSEAPNPWKTPDEDEVERLVSKITGQLLKEKVPEETPNKEEPVAVEEKPMGIMTPMGEQ